MWGQGTFRGCHGNVGWRKRQRGTPHRPHTCNAPHHAAAAPTALQLPNLWHRMLPFSSPWPALEPKQRPNGRSHRRRQIIKVLILRSAKGHLPLTLAGNRPQGIRKPANGSILFIPPRWEHAPAACSVVGSYSSPNREPWLRGSLQGGRVCGCGTRRRPPLPAECGALAKPYGQAIYDGPESGGRHNADTCEREVDWEGLLRLDLVRRV